MRKLVAMLFGLLILATGFVAATIWQTTVVKDYSEGVYGIAVAEVGVKYDINNPYTNYEITYKTGYGGLKDEYHRQMLLTGNPYITVSKDYQSNGIIVKTYVYFDLVRVETVVASAGWPYT